MLLQKALLVSAFMSIFFGYCFAFDVNEPNDVNGPTVELFDGAGKYPENELADFMYFVPLISPVPVGSLTNVDNEQKGHLLSYKAERKNGGFKVTCEFRMKGDGFYLNRFDPDAMIEWNTQHTVKKDVLNNILNYIKFEGQGFGRIEVEGSIKDSKMTAEKVDVYFNARGAKSPVTIGLFDVDLTEQKNGHYKRSNYKVARITTLSFRRSEQEPKLGIKISAVGRDEDSLGALEKVKGFIGNFFIDPIVVDKLGNQTMLDFGIALFEKEEKFTFPKAKNLKSERETKVAQLRAEELYGDAW